MLFSCHLKNLTLNIEIHTAFPIYRSQFICYLFANRTDLRRIYLMLWAQATYIFFNATKIVNAHLSNRINVSWDINHFVKFYVMQFRHKTNFASSIISAPKTITDYTLDSIHCKDKRKNKSIWEGVCALLQLINSRHSEDFISKDRFTYFRIHVWRSK